MTGDCFICDARRFVEYITAMDDLLALVVLNGERDGKSWGKNSIGFYQNRERFYDHIDEVDGYGNVYVNLNQLNPDVFGRSANKLKLWSPTRYSNDEVVRRRAMLVDFDPKRVSGVNSTDDELQAAIEVATRVAEHLQEMWQVDSLNVMSGNGAQLLYLIDEPADTPLVEQVLKYLDEKFSTETVKVDTSVSDAARITRLPGTLNCKGDDVPGRPRRRAKILSMPEERKVVSTEQLAMLVPISPAGKRGAGPRHKGSGTQYYDGPAARRDWTYEKLEALLENQYKAYKGHGWDYKVEQHRELGQLYKLQQCPFIEHHVEYRAALWLNDGVLCYKCFSDDCDGENKKTGHDFVQLIAPEPHLAITDELRLARHVISVYSRDGSPTLRCYRGEWYEWDGCWHKLEEDAITTLLFETCKQYVLDTWPPNLVDRYGNPKSAPKVTKSLLTNVTIALKSLTTAQEIGWVDGRGGRWLAFQDQLLDLDAWIDGDVVFVPQTPAYFAPTVLPYALEYTEDEPTILLEKLREQVTESEVMALQEFGGYCLTTDTSIQRILYMVGPPRSFKGTFERVIRATIGEHNAVSKSFGDFLGAHALENVPGKTFLAISDSRPDPKLSRRAVERLLGISGEDPQDINPKGKTPYTAKLDCKIVIVSNIIADYNDPTGALLSRFLFAETTKSYAANPDPTLLKRILEQRKEITSWFLRGLRRLMIQGGYTEPTNDLKSRFYTQNNPVPAFVTARCNVTGKLDDKVNRDQLFDSFEAWCLDEQIACQEKSTFFRELYAAYPKVKGRERYVSGIEFLAV